MMTDFLEIIQIFIACLLSFAIVIISLVAIFKLVELSIDCFRDFKNYISKKKNHVAQMSSPPYIPSLAEELAKNYESDYDRFYWEKKKTGEGWTDEEIKIAWENRKILTTLYSGNEPYATIYDYMTINEVRELLAIKTAPIMEYPSRRKD